MTMLGIFTSQSVVANGGYLTIRPDSGKEAVVHNIYADDNGDVDIIELYRSDGTNDILVGTFKGSYVTCYFHVSNGYYMKVKNVSGISIPLGYDGVYTVES